LGARENGIEGSTKFILAHIAGIVNARVDQGSAFFLVKSNILLFVSTALFCHN